MGISVVGAHLVMFIVTMIAISIVSAAFFNNIDSLVNAMNEKTNINVNKMRTDVTITVLSCTTNNLTAYVENTGKTRLLLNKIVTYVDGIYTNANISIINDSFNPNIWDPDETIEINISKSLSSGTHKFEIQTQYGVTDSEICSVS